LPAVCHPLPTEQLRQLRDIRRDPTRLIEDDHGQPLAAKLLTRVLICAEILLLSNTYGDATMRLSALLISIAISAALTGSAVSQTFQFQSGPIKFRRACFSTADRGDICWIVADGEITADTPKQFRQFLLANKIQYGAGLEVYLNLVAGEIE
jgi:hypothetical protein